jgi:hypothetical protein
MGIDVFDPSCREFFSGHFKTYRIFFVYENFSKKNRFFDQIFKILQGVQNPDLETPYEELER